MAVNGRTRQRGAMTALIWKCQGMDVYVPEIVQTFGVQTLEQVNLTVAIERRVRGRVDFNDFTLRNIDPNFHDLELINGMCQDCTAFWRTRAVKRSRGKTDLSFFNLFQSSGTVWPEVLFSGMCSGISETNIRAGNT